MNRRGWAGVIAGVVALGAVGLVAWRPWAKTPSADQPPDAPAAGQPAAVVDPAQLLDPARLVQFVCVNESGGPCKVTIIGGYGDSRASMSANFGESSGRSSSAVAGPYTIDSITVERPGGSWRQEMKQTVPAGERREVRVRPDGTAEVVPVPR